MYNLVQLWGSGRNYKLNKRASHQSWNHLSPLIMLLIFSEIILKAYQIRKAIQNVCDMSWLLLNVFKPVRESKVVGLVSVVSYQKEYSQVSLKK